MCRFLWDLKELLTRRVTSIMHSNWLIEVLSEILLQLHPLSDNQLIKSFVWSTPVLWWLWLVHSHCLGLLMLILVVIHIWERVLAWFSRGRRAALPSWTPLCSLFWRTATILCEMTSALTFQSKLGFGLIHPPTYVGDFKWVYYLIFLSKLRLRTCSSFCSFLWLFGEDSCWIPTPWRRIILRSFIFSFRWVHLLFLTHLTKGHIVLSRILFTLHLASSSGLKILTTNIFISTHKWASLPAHCWILFLFLIPLWRNSANHTWQPRGARSWAARFRYIFIV